MSNPTSSRRPSGRGGLKALITVGSLSATALGWFLYGQPASAQDTPTAQVVATLPAGWTDLLQPLPTLVPASTSIASPSVPAAQPVLRRVSLPAPKPVVITVTRSSH
jgi:hypothetical protein